MSYPTLAKTWQFVHFSIEVTGVLSTDSNDFFLKFKNAALAFGSNPPTVAGSSDGSTANMTGTDLLTGQPAVVRNYSGSAHSWIVLAFPQISVGAQVCFDLNNPASTCLIDIVASPTGFSGGSTTDRPTAADETVICANGSLTGMLGTTPSTGGQARGHLMLSTDGEGFRLVVTNNGVVGGFLLIDKAGNPVSGWTDPLVSIFLGTGGADNTSTYVLSFASLTANYFAAQGPVGQMLIEATSEGYSGGVLAEDSDPSYNANQITGEYGMYSLGMYHQINFGQRGRHGHFVDLFITKVVDNFPPIGAVCPAKYILFGNVLFPWDGIPWLLS